jgi:hypothetical protein
MKILVFLFFLILLSLKFVVAATVKIEFTADGSYSIEVAKIDVGDTIEWLPKNVAIMLNFLQDQIWKHFQKLWI